MLLFKGGVLIYAEHCICIYMNYTLCSHFPVFIDMSNFSKHSAQNSQAVYYKNVSAKT